MAINNRVKQGKGTSFTNINDIVAANRKNRLGQTVSGGVSNVIGQGQQQLGQAKTQFQDQAQKNALGTQEHQQQAKQTIEQAGSGTTQGDIDRFAQFRAGQYKGPTELQNKEQIIGQGQQIQGIANAAKGEQGRRGLLQQFVAPDQQYTQGQQRLDNLLLGQTGGQALRGARQAANQFNQQLIQADQSTQAQAKGLQEQARQFGLGVQKQLGEAETGLQSQLKSRAELEQKKTQDAYDALKVLLTKPPSVPNDGGVSTMPVGGLRPKITQEQYNNAMEILSKNPELISGSIYGLENYIASPETLIGQTVPTATATNVAKEEDRQRALALAKLSGGAPTLLGEETQIGDYDPLSFLNVGNWKKSVGQAKDVYNQAIKDIEKFDQYNPVAQYRYSNDHFWAPLQNLLYQTQYGQPGYQAYADKFQDYLADIQGLANRSKSESDKDRYNKLANVLQTRMNNPNIYGNQAGGDISELRYFQDQFRDIYNQIGSARANESNARRNLQLNPNASLLDRLQGLIG